MNYSWHSEPHFSQRNNWLRASVLGANDGLISTAGLLMGMAAASPDTHTLLLTGAAALASGALSMAAGEYVSVSSQSDTEKADLDKERRVLHAYPEQELAELAHIYETRGLPPDLALQVAQALTRHNALEAHARDEIGITDTAAARPFQAALASAVSFCCGAILPVVVALAAPEAWRLIWLACTTVLGLMLLGTVSAKLGGAPVLPALRRIVLWGVVALVVTGSIGRLLGVAVT